MSTNEPIDELPVPMDRREETAITQQPDYETTEQVIHDVATERQLSFFRTERIAWTILTTLEIFLGLRFFLKWIAANPNSGFAALLYWITDLVLAPFAGLVGNPTHGDSIFEVTTLLAMAIYALLFWVVIRVIAVTRSAPEELAADAESERTPYTPHGG
jgi:hypothetical protein